MHLPARKQHCTTVYFDAGYSGKLTGPADAEQYKPKDLIAAIEKISVYLEQDTICVAGHLGSGHQVLAYGIEHSKHSLGIITITIDALATDGARAEKMLHRVAKKKTPEKAR
jgi:proline iminopeptidase